MKILIAVLITVLCIGHGCTMHNGDLFPDFHVKKVTLAVDDLRAVWELNQELMAGPKERLKFITLQDMGDFDGFYEKILSQQQTPDEDVTFLNLNPLSGIYLFYLNKNDPKPIGFMNIDSTLDYGMLGEETLVFKSNAPKGIGGKALEFLKKQADKYRGKELMFCIEQANGIYQFTKGTFQHIIAGIDYKNIASLITHTRAGMKPFFPVSEGDKKGIYMIYPQIDTAAYERDYPEFSAGKIAPYKELMPKMSSILTVLSEAKDKTKALEIWQGFTIGVEINYFTKKK